MLHQHGLRNKRVTGVCVMSAMQHYGTGQVGEVLHHHGRAELGTG